MLEELFVKNLFGSFVAVFCRSVGLISVLPIGSGVLGFVGRIWLAFGLALTFVGYLPYQSDVGIMAILAEYLMGFCLGLPCALAINLSEMFGELVDSGRGETIGNIYDPLNSTAASHTSTLLRHFSWGAVLLLGALERLVASFVESFSVIPAGAFEMSKLGYLALHVASYIAISLGELLSFFLPMALLFLLIEKAFGYLSKILGSGSLSSESFQAKTFIAFFILSSLTIFDFEKSLLVISEPLLHLLRSAP